MRECVNMGSSTLQTGEMEHFVVGDKPCTFVEVRDALSHCATAANLWSKLIEIARSLEIPADKIILLKTQTLTQLITYPDALYEILEIWRGKSAANATLQTFINVLETGPSQPILYEFASERLMIRMWC
ncbi:unnamed protein product [Orchesella dallaii]|uniref:Death domain-containing protein n=1 Tax=Orchesella dallaii TaxID=48710 RepID=A0ABP1RA70_9HEXA